jgi:murein DD-endopeptidase MepM/ murein hydrolase activator NlpD
MKTSAKYQIARAFPILGFVLLFSLVGSGCSSALKQTNPKMGLLDILAEMEPANHSRSESTDEARDHDEVSDGGTPQPLSHNTTRAPGAVEVKAPQIAEVKGMSLQWPLKEVQVTSTFGKRGREFHEGVDLRAKAGTPVYAAHAGQILYANSRIKGYGNMIVIKHSSGVATIYAHNSKLVVHRGQWVRQGALIAYTGNTGHSTGPHLHFEVRSGISAINPLAVLPKRDRLVAARDK